MKFTSKMGVAAAALALGLGTGVASAQMMGWYYPAETADGQTYYVDPGCMGYYYAAPVTLQQRQDLYQNSLNLNADQQQKFSNYANAVYSAAVQESQKTAPASDTNQALLNRIANLKAQLSATENVLQARNDLIKSLTPEQQKELSILEN